MTTSIDWSKVRTKEQPRVLDKKEIPAPVQEPSNRNYIPLFYLCCTAAWLLYFLLTPPVGLVINETGEVIGYSNILKEKVQGAEFWASQKVSIQKEIVSLEAAAKNKNELRDSMREALAENKNSQEKIYESEPALRPSQEFQYASYLRDLALLAEMAGLDAERETRREEKLLRLRTTLTHIK